MSIINVKEVTPRSIRGVIPEDYRAMPYIALNEGDKITIKSCVFSVYPARNKETHEPMRVEKGPNAGKLITNITVYFELSDGHYTSLKNDVVTGQMCALTGFDDSSDVGYYRFDFEPETVTVCKTETKMGQKTVPILAFQQ